MPVINKVKLGRLIGKKLDHNIHKQNIMDVISLFVDEFAKELEIKKRINIPNFCVFLLEKNKPRKYHDIQKRQILMSDGKPMVKIKLSQAFRDRIIQELDIFKTFL